MNENVTSNHNVPAPAEPVVLNEPLRNRGVAFTAWPSGRRWVIPGRAASC